MHSVYGLLRAPNGNLATSMPAENGLIASLLLQLHTGVSWPAIKGPGDVVDSPCILIPCSPPASLWCSPCLTLVLRHYLPCRGPSHTAVFLPSVASTCWPLPGIPPLHPNILLVNSACKCQLGWYCSSRLRRGSFLLLEQWESWQEDKSLNLYGPQFSLL